MATEDVTIEIKIQASKSAKTLKELAKSGEDLADTLADLSTTDKNFKKLNKALDETNNQFNDLLVTSDKALLTFGELELAQESLIAELKETDRGSERFKILQQEIVQVNKEIGNTELGLVGLNSEDVAGAFGQLTGAVGTITSSFVLLGGEGNRTMEEIGANIEQAVGISQAFNGAVEGISAGTKLWKNYKKTLEKNAIAAKIMAVVQKALNFVMKANPVFLLIAAFTALLGLFALFSANTNDAEKESEDLNKSLEKQARGYEQLVKRLDELDKARQNELDNNKILLSSEAELIKSKGILTEADKERLKQIGEDVNQIELDKLDSSITTTTDKFGALGTQIETQFKQIDATIRATAWEDGINNTDYKKIRQKNTDLKNSLKELLKEGFTPENVDAQISAINKLEAKQNRFIETLQRNSLKLGSAELEIFEKSQEQASNLSDLLGSLDENAVNYKNTLSEKVVVTQLQEDATQTAINVQVTQDLADAETRREERATARAEKKKSDAEAEKRRIIDLAKFEEELFQENLASDEERTVRKLTLELEANILRAETLIKDEDKLQKALKQLKQQTFNEIEKLENAEIELNKEKTQALINANKTTSQALLILEQQQALVNAEFIDDEIKREKAKSNILKKLASVRIGQIKTASEIELQNLELTEKQRLEIIKKTELAISEIKAEEVAKQREITTTAVEEDAELREQLIEAGFQALTAIADAAFEIASINRQQEFDRRNEELKSQYETENELLKSQLERGTITQRKFDRESVKLEKERIKAEEALKKKAFQKDKEAKIVQAAINGALAITQSFAQLGPVAGAIAAALVSLTTALQIGIISKSKYARGGILQGPSHSEGGIKTAYGEVEGGEAVINKTSTELFRTELSAINQAGGGVRFARGGILGNAKDKLNEPKRISEALENLDETLSRPIKAFITETDLSNSLNRKSALENNASL
mgnify:FL=1